MVGAACDAKALAAIPMATTTRLIKCFMMISLNLHCDEVLEVIMHIACPNAVDAGKLIASTPQTIDFHQVFSVFGICKSL